MISYVDIRGWGRDQWLKFREMGIGGSELGGVFNESKWDDALKVWLNKIGEPVTTFTGNPFTEAGQWLEAHIADMYQYWDHRDADLMKMYERRRNKQRVNTVRSVFAYVVNDKYPWLFASMDRRILRDKRKKGRGVLECKNTTSMEKNTYTHGINPGHVLQVYQYLMITEWEYADVMIFFDGNNWDCVTFEPDKEVFEMIEYETAKFWKSVEEARRIKEEYNIPSYYGMPDYYFNDPKQYDGISMLQSMEPEITDVTYDWIKGLIVPTPTYTEMEGTQEIFELAVQYHNTVKARGEHDKELDRIKACIIAELSGIHVARFDDGVVSYKPTSSGENRLHISDKLMK